MLKFFAVFLTCSAFCMSFSASASSGHNNTQELKKILSHYDRWEGVRYKFGGNSRKGIDCSAYMQRVFQDEFAVSLPRSTGEQMKLGSRVAKSELNTGDLVFFKTSSRQRHVGVYIGEGEFVHASTSMGVTVSSLDNQYWGERYELARRINGSDA
ncbi:NlpC/P60 family protein [Serratia sp. PL7]|jgi:lipoprotein Spr|nr:NlpC/P60 family protein [Serratia sp. PL7]MBE0151110.1 hydrolase [Serratia fonticola]OKP30051.1 hydrolase [Serratia fonticola]HBE9082342.1 C40 family peptidase [Serratia fonticola]HBE9093007.1 C40 family peptidase [Serratia fonticola]HBE9155177.1 C40 family peptidase [Serratia fonticola]